MKPTNGGGRIEVVGSFTIREHCVFHWREDVWGKSRLVEVRPEHCEICIAGLQELAKTQPLSFVDLRARIAAGNSAPHRENAITRPVLARGSRRDADGDGDDAE